MPAIATAHRSGWSLAFAVGFALLATAIGVEGRNLTADGVRIEYGLAPASVVRAHPESHEETRMHDGPPAGQSSYHLVVALFDALGGTRIENADVAASIGPLGVDGAFRRLEAMHTGGVISYGGYFHVGTPGHYRIRFEVRRPGWRDPIAIAVDHKVESAERR